MSWKLPPARQQVLDEAQSFHGMRSCWKGSRPRSHEHPRHLRVIQPGYGEARHRHRRSSSCEARAQPVWEAPQAPARPRRIPLAQSGRLCDNADHPGGSIRRSFIQEHPTAPRAFPTSDQHVHRCMGALGIRGYVPDGAIKGWGAARVYPECSMTGRNRTGSSKKDIRHASMSRHRCGVVIVGGGCVFRICVPRVNAA